MEIQFVYQASVFYINAHSFFNYRRYADMTNYKNVGNFDPHLVSTKFLQWRASRRAQNEKCCSNQPFLGLSFTYGKLARQFLYILEIRAYSELQKYFGRSNEHF